jgi:hypothetical protein
MDVSDLGRKVKRKYPGTYDDLSDAEVGRRVKAKFPEYADFDEIDNEPIKSEVTAPLLRGLSYALYVICFFSLIGISRDYLNRTTYSWIAVSSGVLGLYLARLSKQAYQKEVEELSSKIEVKKKQAELQEHLIREPHAPDKVRLKMLLEQIQANAERRRAELDNTLLETAKQTGLTPVEVVEINKEKYLSEIRLAEREGVIQQDTRRTRELTEIELEKRWREIVQDLDAGDLLDLSDQQLIKKQTERLEEMYRQRHELLYGPDPEDVKVYLLARYDKNIQHLEAKIDARQTGLLLPPNGQKTKRLTTKAEGGADYPAAVDADDI